MSPSAASQSARNPRERARWRDVEVNHGIRRNAEAIKRGFDEYRVAFSRITRRAKNRFDQRNWPGTVADARVRLGLYDRIVRRVIGEVRSHALIRNRDVDAWASVKRIYAELIAGTGASGIAETFFNSVTRSLFDVVGVDPSIEFVDFEFQRIPTGLGDTPYRSYASIDGTEAQICDVFADYAFETPYRDMIADAGRVAQRIDTAWDRGAAPLPFEVLEVLKPVFYRRKGAYLIGRARGGPRVMPVVIALRNGPQGIYADAVLAGEEDLSIAFSFAHSPFQVDIDRPAETIEFLRSLMPRKPRAELTRALGFDRHGKTELYRQLRRHLGRTSARFETVPGEKGAVMTVFGLPGFNMVFKIIRDEAPGERETTAEEVRRRYDLVAHHDRGGRLVDALEFDRVVVSRARFSRDLLEELTSSASQSISIVGEDVLLERVYTMSRVEPLDLSLQHATDETRRQLLDDYKQAILDLATMGWFAGDLSFKNFGVTRLGRVVFYGYDDLRRLDECVFRELHGVAHRCKSRSGAGGSWEVFPESFTRFISLSSEEREHFLATHAELFQPIYWQLLQDRHASGEVVDVLPYRGDRRIWSDNDQLPGFAKDR
jgi:isocitrate dehydrogenase kinase/phosphatase